MRNIFLTIGIILMLLGIFGVSYTWTHDHRNVETLEEYATLDFKTARNEEGQLDSANLSLWDYRYDRAQLLNKAVILINGAAWETTAATKQTQSGWQYENKLFVSLPKGCFKDMLMAKEIRLKFYYDNGQTIDLPLGPKEMIVWQRKLRW